MPKMAENTKVRLTQSIFVRVVLLVSVVTVLIIAFLTATSIRVSSNVVRETLEVLGTEYTGLLAQESGGAFKFRKSEELQALLDTTTERLGTKIDAAIAIATDGEVLASFNAPGTDISATRAIAQRALGEQSQITESESLTFASPAVFGDAVVGAVAIHWTSEALLAGANAQKMKSLSIGGLVFVALILGLTFALRQMIAKPLSAIAVSMREVADGNYDVDIPEFSRGNEVGRVLNALESFRDRVRGAAETARTAAFKGAGFDSSSACLMIADADCNIVFANPAYGDLVAAHGDAMRARLPNFNPDKIIGGSIDAYHKNPSMQRSMLAKLTKDHHAEVEFGDTLLGLVISPIDNEDGTRMGYVVEWKDVTEERRNSAIMETFQSGQAMAEFSGDGTLISANSVVAQMAGRAPDELVGTRLAELVQDGAGQTLASVDEPIFGDLRVTSARGAHGSLVGGLTPIRNREGEIKKIVLLGADVTEAKREMSVAAEEQMRLRDEQHRMIDALREGLGRLADGNLTTELTEPFSVEHDQLRHDFNEAMKRLSDTMTSVTARSNAIREDVVQITSAADDLSRRTEHQAATLEETAAALTQLTASVNSAAEGARQANEVVLEARSNAEASGGVVRDAVEAMGKISDSSVQISSIISVIDDIAFQTNLLALNAGVEAARAGDAGRGFAVVASEVRALAQRSSEAAREIATLISASGEHVERGVTLVGNAGSALEGIVASVSGIADHVSSIASSAQEQKTGLGEINDAMGDLDQVTQQNAAMFEETTAAAHALAGVGNDLTSAVAHFKLKDGQGTVARQVENKTPEPAPQRATGTHGPAQTSEEVLDQDWEDF